LEIHQFGQIAESEWLPCEHRFVDPVRRTFGQCDPKRLLDFHEQFDKIQAVAVQIFDDSVTGRNLPPIDPQLL
jgi:hypothetical protein